MHLIYEHMMFYMLNNMICGKHIFAKDICNVVTGKEDETVDGSRVRKTGEVAADEEVVKTGDNNHVWVYIEILVAAAVISGTVIVISKKSNKR